MDIRSSNCFALPYLLRHSVALTWIFGTLLLFYSCGQKPAKEKDRQSEFKDGDIIFQSLRSGQSDAIQLATHSKYSHCGIVFWQGDQCYVFEASKNVRATPLRDFLDRGKGGHYAVRRLKAADSVFSSTEVAKSFINNYYTLYDGKPYDIYYAESDEKIYCSELIWKLYNASVRLDIAAWEQLGDFDLSSKVVQAELRYTYGEQIPFAQRIMSPEALFVSDKLVTIIEK